MYKVLHVFLAESQCSQDGIPWLHQNRWSMCTHCVPRSVLGTSSTVLDAGRVCPGGAHRLARPEHLNLSTLGNPQHGPVLPALLELFLELILR